jgi:invasion protein IalB
MTRLSFAVPALCLALAAHVPALAQQSTQRGGQKPAAPATAPGGGQATLVATFNDWSAYTAQTGRSKICYALSQPKSRTPANLKDTPAYLFISFRPAENVRNEVATVLGFATKEGGAAEAAIGSTSYPLVTKGSNAWMKNPADEAQAIATMSKGQAIVVSATSARGNKTSDRYSLNGFSQALERAKKECP